jgi:hypothetical protein
VRGAAQTASDPFVLSVAGIASEVEA